MTEEQKQILLTNGWHREYNANYYRCRICHNVVWEGWSSPKYSFYHNSCVLKSAQIRKLLKKEKNG